MNGLLLIRYANLNLLLIKISVAFIKNHNAKIMKPALKNNEEILFNLKIENVMLTQVNKTMMDRKKLS